VTVASTSGGRLEVVQQLQNIALDSNPPRGTSTWGIGIAKCGEPPENWGSLLVSANDHCLKSWWLRPSAEASNMQASRQTQRVAERWQVRQTRKDAAQSSERPPWLLHQFDENLPCVDLSLGRAIVTCLDGTVCSFEVCAPAHDTADEATATESHSVEDEPRERTLTSEAADGQGPKFPPNWPEVSGRDTRGQLKRRPRVFLPSLHSMPMRRTWNACWVPLNSIKEVFGIVIIMFCSKVATPPLPPPPANSMEWSTASSGMVLPGEIIKSSLLQLMQASLPEIALWKGSG